MRRLRSRGSLQPRHQAPDVGQPGLGDGPPAGPVWSPGPGHPAPPDDHEAVHPGQQGHLGPHHHGLQDRDLLPDQGHLQTEEEDHHLIQLDVHQHGVPLVHLAPQNFLPLLRTLHDDLS